MSIAENVDLAVGSLFTTSVVVELKICYMFYAVHKLCLLLQILSRHIGHLVSARLVHLIALSYSGMGTNAIPLTPSGYEMV